MTAQFKTSPKGELDYFPPMGDSDQKSAIVIFPGGGYRGLAEHEGKGYAEFFASRGFHAFVCEYRVNNSEERIEPAPLEDALSAVSTVRARATELGFDPTQVGVIGSSAGGHLAAHVSTVSTGWGREYRPDWAILCYPVIGLSGPSAHTGSRKNLLGVDSDDDLAASFSPQNLVDENTPPTFLWHTLEDPVVPIENSLLFAEALRRTGIPFELHISERGGHGLGRKADFGWAERAVSWLEITGRVGS